MQHPIETTELKAVKLDMLPNELPKPKKKMLGKSFIIFFAILIVVVFIIFLIGYSSYKNSQKIDIVEEPSAKTVKTMIVSSNLAKNIIKTVGQVKASAQVDVLSKSNGKAVKINFNLGSYITQGTILAELENEITLRSFETARIGLKSASDNLANTKALQIKIKTDTKNNALISIDNYKNSIKNALNQTNYIILAEVGNQLPFIASVLSAKNSQVLIIAKMRYLEAKTTYNNLKNQTFTADNIIIGLKNVINSLIQVQRVVDATILVLDNTVSSANFSGASLLAQQNSLAALKTSVINTKTGTELTLQNLENLTLINKQKLDALENAKSLALSQLNLSKTAYDNLFIKAPISGKITKKNIELGKEIMPNQSIAEVSQTNNLKVEIYLTIEEASLINVNQTVLLNNSLFSSIISIAPTADFASKKIKVEITVSPSASLIPGSFANVLIETNIIGSLNSIFIPLNALTLTQTESFVFIVNNNKVEKRKVTIGKTENRFIEITSGLSIGEEIVTIGSKEITNNETIIINN